MSVLIVRMVCLHENKLGECWYHGKEYDELKTQNQHYKQKNGATLIMD
jgi:hypothetical protein